MRKFARMWRADPRERRRVLTTFITATGSALRQPPAHRAVGIRGRAAHPRLRHRHRHLGLHQRTASCSFHREDVRHPSSQKTSFFADMNVLIVKYVTPPSGRRAHLEPARSGRLPGRPRDQRIGRHRTSAPCLPTWTTLRGRGDLANLGGPHLFHRRAGTYPARKPDFFTTPRPSSSTTPRPPRVRNAPAWAMKVEPRRNRRIGRNVSNGGTGSVASRIANTEAPRSLS